jgi:hypothetical protein
MQAGPLSCGAVLLFATLTACGSHPPATGAVDHTGYAVTSAKSLAHTIGCPHFKATRGSRGRDQGTCLFGHDPVLLIKFFHPRSSFSEPSHDNAAVLNARTWQVSCSVRADCVTIQKIVGGTLR